MDDELNNIPFFVFILIVFPYAERILEERKEVDELNQTIKEEFQ